VAFAFAASLTFGLCLVITENETRGLDGRLRTLSTLGIVGLLAVAAALSGDGFQLPNASPGWWGLMLLTFLYGTAFTVMFTVLPKLGVVGNSAIMNVEPVFALLLAWALLGQTIAPMQVGGASLVVVSVMWLGLRKG
jgi:drug/metabolite transporter (DMT)-like permease